MKHILSVLGLAAHIAVPALRGADMDGRLIEEARAAMQGKGIIIPADSPVRVLPEVGYVFVEFYNRDYSLILVRAYFDRHGKRFLLIDSRGGGRSPLPKIDGCIDLSSFTTADSLWREIATLAPPEVHWPPVSGALKMEEEVEGAQVSASGSSGQSQPYFETGLWKSIEALRDKYQFVPKGGDVNWRQIFYATSQFLMRYPQDPRRWEARMLWFQNAPFMDVPMVRQFLGEAIAADDAPEALRASAKHWLDALNTPRVKPEATPARETESPYDERLDGKRRIADAIIQATAEHKRIYMEIGDNGIFQCLLFRHFIMKDAAVARALETSYVPVLLAMNNRDAAVLRGLGDTVQDSGLLPSIMILDSDGTMLALKNSSELSGKEGYSEEKTLGFLLQWKKPR